MGSSSTFLILGLVISVVSTAGSFFYSDKFVLLTSGAKPADKKTYFDVYTVTENMAIASGVPMPKLYVIQDQSPNAFATGRDPKHGVICVTTGLLSILNRSEIEGVIAHELSHIKNYDTLLMSVVSVLVGTIALASNWIMQSLWWGGRDSDSRSDRNPIFFIGLILSIIIGPIVATLMQLAISRRREYLADASGALLTRHPEGLASALEKISAYPVPLRSANPATAHLFISSPFRKTQKSSLIQSLFSTHPATEDRVRILRTM